MIRLTIQDLHRESPKCPNDCHKYRVEGCVGNCSLRFRSVYKCPHCGVVKCFYGCFSQSACPSCHKPLEDLGMIKSDNYKTIRIKYHLGEPTESFGEVIP